MVASKELDGAKTAFRARRKKLEAMAKSGQLHEAAVELAVQLHFDLLMSLDADYTERKKWGQAGQIRDDELAAQVREVTKSLAQAINQARGLERDGSKFAEDLSDGEKKKVVGEYLKTLSETERAELLKL